MQVYKSADGQVIKYVHGDLSETAVKFNSSCTGDSESNKATIFLSVSSGCNQGCKMCYLTIKKMKYKPLTNIQIWSNFLNVIGNCKEEIKDKYVKISFMGMGDVSLLSGVDIIKLVESMVDYINRYKVCLGIDGVDFGTSLPKVSDSTDFFSSLSVLNNWLFRTESCNNPSHKYVKFSDGKNRTPVRLFYSLHSTDKNIREGLIPNSQGLFATVDQLNKLTIDVIYHYTLIDSVNNSDQDVEDIKSFFDILVNPRCELRLLRYNSCEGTDLKEPTEENFNSVVKRLSNQLFKFKYQVSTGSDMKAACGQFLIKEINDK